MQLHKAALGIDLRMQGDHPPSGTVIVNEQVVNAHDLWMGKHNAADFCDKLRVGSLTEQRIDGIPGRAYAGIKDEDRDQKTAPAVDGKTDVYKRQPQRPPRISAPRTQTALPRWMLVASPPGSGILICKKVKTT